MGENDQNKWMIEGTPIYGNHRIVTMLLTLTVIITPINNYNDKYDDSNDNYHDKLIY